MTAMAPFPLSRSQEIVWLHEELFPDSRAYQFTAVLTLRGDLRVDALIESLTALIVRHPGLRLELTDDDPVQQRISDEWALRWEMVDVRSSHDREAAFADLLRERHTRPFDLYQAPLIRWCLAHIADNEYRLLHTEHHLVHDGASFAIILRDLFTLYRDRVTGSSSALPSARPYADLVAWERSEEAIEQRNAALAYWRQKLADTPAARPLGSAPIVPGAADANLAGEQYRQTIERHVADRLRDTARANGQTVFSTLLALFAELLRRTTGTDDLVIGTAVGNRPPGFENTVGMFVNTIPLRIRLDGAPDDAVDVIDEVTDTLLEAIPHQGIPIQDLTHHLGRRSSTGLDNPLFRVMFSSHDTPLPTIELPDISVSIYEAVNVGTSRFDLDVLLIPDSERTVNPRPGAGGMTLAWEYTTAAFKRDEIVAMSNRFAAMVSAYAENPISPLRTLGTDASATTKETR